MVTTSPVQMIKDFLGSAHIFASAVDDLMEQQLEMIGGDMLTFSQLKLLKLVGVTDGYTIGDVASFLGVSNAAASKAVDRLVRRHLIQRRESEEDRRVVILSLTEEGRQFLRRYETAATKALEEMFAEFSADELREGAELLDSLSLRLMERGGDDSRRGCFRCGIYFREKCLLREQGRPGCYFHLHTRNHRGVGSG